MMINAQSERIQNEIKKRAQLFCLDNPFLSGANMGQAIELAMTVGASIAFEAQAETERENENDCTPEAETLLKMLFESGSRPLIVPEMGEEKEPDLGAMLKEMISEDAKTKWPFPCGSGKTYKCE